MIKLIYSVIVDDSEALLASLHNQSISVKGISTIDDSDAPQTFIFVADDILDEQKLQIDEEVRLAPKKPVSSERPNQPTEETVVDEPREL